MNNSWIELDLSVLGENLRNLRKALSPRAEIIFVVKSNAYGHGMLPVAKHAWKCGVKWFAVAHIDEALTLRKALPKAEIIIVGAIDPADAPVAARNNLISVIVDEKHARAIGSSVSKSGLKLRCHAKVDTGMGRLGFAWERAGRILPLLVREKGLSIQGLCSHFASAHPSDRRFADVQAQRFMKVAGACEKAGFPRLFKHVSNSGGISCDSAWDMDGVRPGILLYGYGSAKLKSEKRKTTARKVETNPFLQWKTRVVQIKKVPAGFPVSYDSTHVTKRGTHIATIDVGYADGYHRALSNKGIVVVGGQRRPVVGRVTMNLIMVDLGPRVRVRERDEVVLIGKQGPASIWADELAALAGTIPYEILTSIRTEERQRIKRWKM